MSVYFYGCITMDGYLADKNHQLDWLHQTGTVEDTGYEEFYKQIDITIMGKKTFAAIADLEGIAEMYAQTRNYVFTHAQTLPVSNFIPVRGDVIKFVQKIDPNKNTWIVGGNTILALLLENDMIDCLIIQIAPVILGAGIPLFTQRECLKRFILRDVKQFGQFAELIYCK